MLNGIGSRLGPLTRGSKQSEGCFYAQTQVDEVKFQLRTSTQNPFAQMKESASKPLKPPKLFATEKINQKSLEIWFKLSNYKRLIRHHLLSSQELRPLHEQVFCCSGHLITKSL